MGLQSVIITGESGAGKSEACKLVLQFIADLSAGHSGRTVTEDEQSLEQQLLQVTLLRNMIVISCRLWSYPSQMCVP